MIILRKETAILPAPSERRVLYMGYLFVNENGATIGIEANQFYVKYKDGLKKMIPAESLESITVLGKVQLTTQCIEECLKRGIPVAYFFSYHHWWFSMSI